MPIISIAMATYNGERYLAQQLDSLAKQSVAPAELHIGDDGSTDSTERIVRAFAETAPFPVHFTRNDTQLGYGENFIQTALRCTGDWIAFCDQDDLWSPDKLRWAASRIGDGPTDLVLIAHNAEVVDECGKAKGLLYRYPHEQLSQRLELSPEWYCAGFTQVFRGDLLRDVPYDRRVSFPWHTHRGAHDVWISLLANCTGTILRTSNPLAIYRRHQETATRFTRTGRLGNLVRTGESYLQRRSYLREVATTLSYCARQSRADMAPLLTSAAQRIERHAEVLELRAAAYSDARFWDRLKKLAILLRRGAYTDAKQWGFGASRFVKDALCAARLL